MGTLPILRRTLLGAALLACAAPAGAAQFSEIVRQGYVDVPGGRIFWKAAGGGRTVVLLGGGSGMDLREWDDHFMLLARSYNVVCVDPRGFGGSTAAAGPFAPHEDILAVLDAMHLAKADLVGGSYAGGIAIDLALTHPDRVSSLVLVAPSVSGYEVPPEIRQREDTLRGILRSKGVDAYVKAVMKDDYFLPARGTLGVRHEARKLLADNAARLLDTDPAWVERPKPPAIERLGEIRTPTLVLVGEDDHPAAIELAGLVASRIEGAEKKVIAKAGHTVYLEKSGGFRRALLEFLARTPAK